MGICPVVSSCGCGCSTTPGSPSIVEKKIALPNPNPKNFEITDQIVIGNYTILWVNYPDCNNFEGKKILVFEGRITNIGKTLDPHFCETSRLVARFVPTGNGDMLARDFCRMMREKDER